MQVPVLSIIFMTFSAALSIGLPVYLFLLARKKLGARVFPMVLGILGFVIFALLLEGSVHRIVLKRFIIREESPALYIVYGIFMAGIFEETARFIAFKILKRKSKDLRYHGIGSGFAYGIGHGGIESALLAGASMVLAIVGSILVNTGNIEVITGRFEGEALAAIESQIEALLSSAPYMFLVSSLERIMAIVVQLSLSILVFHSVFSAGKIWFYPLAILLHAIIDIPAAAFQAGVLKSLVLVEGVLCLCAVLTALFVRYLHKKQRRNFNLAQGPSPGLF
jgi:uncharacterized membrane protein YhfC